MPSRNMRALAIGSGLPVSSASRTPASCRRVSASAAPGAACQALVSAAASMAT